MLAWVKKILKKYLRKISLICVSLFALCIIAIIGNDNLDGIIPEYQITALQLFIFLYAISELFIFVFIYNGSLKSQLRKCWLRKPAYFHITSTVIFLPFAVYLMYRILDRFIVLIFTQLKCLKKH